jgi:hypothetical protein
MTGPEAFGLPEIAVGPGPHDQRVVRAGLRDPATVEHHDLAGGRQRGEPVRDEHDRTLAVEQAGDEPVGRRRVQTYARW